MKNIYKNKQELFIQNWVEYVEELQLSFDKNWQWLLQTKIWVSRKSHYFKMVANEEVSYEQSYQDVSIEIIIFRLDLKLT